jgi:LysR family cys regulon transcriptional activator
VNLQQLRYVVEIVHHGNHLSAAAQALNTSQPGVSRQVQLLEDELGFKIFERKRNRIVGLTEPGALVLALAQRVVADVAQLKAIGEDVNSGARGTLTIAATHTQARYLLPGVVERFIRAYPGVQLVLRQGDPEEICALVDKGEADIAIGTETRGAFPGLIKLDCFDVPRSVVAQRGHPILAVPDLTLEAIAAYPIITYDARYSGRWQVMQRFSDAGLDPKVILSAIDADICKTYVALGLGVAILATMTVNPDKDVEIGARDASHLFPSSTVMIMLRPNTYLRRYLLDFIQLVAPALTEEVVRAAVT